MPTVNELKARLKALGQPTTGSKTLLEARLAALQHLAPSAPAPTSSGKPRPSTAAEDESSKRQKRMDSGLEVLFETLSGGEETIDPAKTLEMCSALGVDPEAFEAVVLSYHLNSPAIGTFDRAGFVKGLSSLKADSLVGIKSVLPDLTRKATYGNRDFDAVYRFAFAWGCEPGIRNLKKEIAIGLWRILVPPSAFALLDEWIAFWEASPARVVTKDEWNSFRRFVDVHRKNELLVESDDAWPTAIDEFVDFAKARGKGSAGMRASSKQ